MVGGQNVRRKCDGGMSGNDTSVTLTHNWSHGATVTTFGSAWMNESLPITVQIKCDLNIDCDVGLSVDNNGGKDRFKLTLDRVLELDGWTNAGSIPASHPTYLVISHNVWLGCGVEKQGRQRTTDSAMPMGRLEEGFSRAKGHSRMQ